MLIIEAVAPASTEDDILRLAKRNDVSDVWISGQRENQTVIKILLSNDKSQKVLDQLQKLMEGKNNFRVLVYPLDLALPNESLEKTRLTRESLYNQLSRESRLDWHFIMLVILSTIVAAIGLIENNVAVIIGAMVIAPLLGPNLALSLATTLGHVKEIKQALITLFSGIGIALAIAWAIGWLYPDIAISEELLSRTHVGLSSLALALASGAAAALSITTGVSSVLVGVMVAVALLPPTVTLGIMAGMQAWESAYGALALLLVNIASVNFTGQLTMRLKGIKPREEKFQTISLWIFSLGIVFWLGLLVLLVRLMPDLV
ncbi:TIGR00341 family protein [Thalassolituus pacificus]|uniref:TIGR00341 family protein n=1 Tax=Thalassolituus pacificus TaxID=2975440 RepID=A0A9X2WHW8_9GAMM|nr:TIGR00341 family protein [Thalassolituus pacificus]MCT7360434.1 TIGR00341 family protein [Thalassolituus pacificus]